MRRAVGVVVTRSHEGRGHEGRGHAVPRRSEVGGEAAGFSEARCLFCFPDVCIGRLVVGTVGSHCQNPRGVAITVTPSHTQTFLD